jgi:hypothetical protein
MMPPIAIDTALRPLVIRVLGSAAIFAIAVLAGCSSRASLPPGTAPSGVNSSTSGRLSGTMDDWVNAVCNSPRFDRGTLMPSATGGGQCGDLASVKGMGPVGRYEFVWGTYPSGSDSAIGSDVAMFGPYAEGNDGTEEVVFAVFMGENHAGLTPLERFGFILHPGKMSACSGEYSHQLVECPPEGEPSNPPPQPPPIGPPPGNINATPPPTVVPPSAASGHQIPPDADAQGFVGYPGARCNDTNPAVRIGRTVDSAVVICETGAGRFYYKGVGLQNGLSVEIDDPVQTGAAFVATNNGVQYSLSPAALIITQGSTVVSREPMLEYWSA